MKYLFIYFFWILCTIGQEISRQKCQEYSSAVYQMGDQVFSLRKRGKTELESTCAIYENPLIVGGTPARAREFPHMAVLGYGTAEDLELEWLCGGSLISEKHVLTAAHCTVSQRGPPQKVKLGIISLDEDDDYVQEVFVEKFKNHPLFKRPQKYHDIALLFLKEPVQFSPFVRPACLNTFEEIPHRIAVATGFGKKAHDAQVTSRILLKVDLNVISTEDCVKYIKFRQFELPQNLIKEMMCAGYLQGGRDACQGDSGGPLQVILEKPYCMYSIIGVTSFGRFCGMPYSPGIYTKVDQYVSWIESTIWM